MSRIYDALKRAAEQARKRNALPQPFGEDKELEVLEPPHHAAGPAAPSPRAPASTTLEPEPDRSATVPPRGARDVTRPPRPPSPPPSREATKLLAPLAPESTWEQVKGQLADQVRVEAWMRLEESALQQLGLGHFPRGAGVSGWLLEAAGGFALGSLIASLSVLLIYVVLVWFLHIRIPELFW